MILDETLVWELAEDNIRCGLRLRHLAKCLDLFVQVFFQALQSQVL